MNALARSLRFRAGLDVHHGWWRVLGLPAPLLAQCAKNPKPRSTALLASRVANRLPLPEMPVVLEVPDFLASLDAEKIGQIVMRAGAVWHGARLKWLIDARDRSRIINRVGRGAFAYGLLNARLSIVSGDRVDAGILADSIGHDGRACWQCWLSAQPVDIRTRLALLSPPAAEAEDRWNAGQKKQARGIVEKILGDLEHDL